MTDQQDRMPRTTIRTRFGRKMLTHGLRLGWRTTDGQEHPVNVYIAPECHCACVGCEEGWDGDE